MSSGEEAWRCLHGRDEPFYAALGRRCLHIGSDRDLEMREGLDLEFVETPGEAEFILNTGPAGWEERSRITSRCCAAAAPATCRWSAPTPTSSSMHGGRPALCAGALAEEYERLGGRVRWHGKPYPSVYESCLELLGIADRRASSRSATACAPTSPAPPAPAIDSLLIAGGVHAAEFESGDALDLQRIDTALGEAKLHPIGVAARFVW